MKKILILIFSVGLILHASAQRTTHPTAKKKYQPTLLSINSHKTPEWFEDAKFGMFIDYGLYSVAGYATKSTGAMYPDWYLYNMYNDPKTKEYHEKTWGKDFQRDDFIPLFTASEFDANALVKLAADAGMQYVVPFCKHHDGFCLWPSTYTKRNTVDMGPKKDLIKPIVDACQKQGLKFGFYFSLEEWEYPILVNGKKMIRRWKTFAEPSNDTIAYNEAEMSGRITGKIPVKDFIGDYIIPQGKEFIKKYNPDLIWFDGEWRTDVNELRTPELVSYFYNNAEGKKEVASNDRLGKHIRFNVGDFFTSEYGSGSENGQTQMMHKWEECRGISQSFGFNWQDTEANVITTQQFIDMFVKIVSENGNLLLVVNLDGKGAVLDYIKSRPLDIGKWLKVNGEAIYGSRPWLFSHQGENIRFTKSKDGKYLYAIHKGFPKEEVTIESLWLDKTARIQMLGSNQLLKWKNVEGVGKDNKLGKVVVEIPPSLKSKINSDFNYILKIQLAK